jgi:hypothetical protein
VSDELVTYDPSEARVAYVLAALVVVRYPANVDVSEELVTYAANEDMVAYVLPAVVEER